MDCHSRQAFFALTSSDACVLKLTLMGLRLALRGPRPRRARSLGPDSYQDALIGPERTPCFRIRKSHHRGPVTRHETECFIGIVTAGSGRLTVGGMAHPLRPFDKFFLPAGLGAWQLDPSPTLDLLECLPPAA